MGPRLRNHAAKAAIAAVVIGGTFAVLWAIYRPTVPTPTRAAPPPPPPVLHDAHARVRVMGPAVSSHTRAATIECDGARRRASGFWAGKAVEACDALAST